MEEKKERLNKYLAACGICSRREADRIIEMGKVTVDGEIASMGMQVTGQEEILGGFMGIRYRFLVSEFHNLVEQKYMDICINILPQFGITVEEL